MMLLSLLDEDGSQQRAKKRLKRRVYRSKVVKGMCMTVFATPVTEIAFQGPNHVWHCDGYDKPKPFCIAVHWCIDGYRNLNNKL